MRRSRPSLGALWTLLILSALGSLAAGQAAPAPAPGLAASCLYLARYQLQALGQHTFSLRLSASAPHQAAPPPSCRRCSTATASGGRLSCSCPAQALNSSTWRIQWLFENYPWLQATAVTGGTLLSNGSTHGSLARADAAGSARGAELDVTCARPACPLLRACQACEQVVSTCDAAGAHTSRARTASPTPRLPLPFRRCDALPPARWVRRACPTAERLAPCS